MDEYGDQIQIHYEDNFDYEEELHHHHHHQQQQQQQQQQQHEEEEEDDDELATDYGIEANDKQPMDHHHHQHHHHHRDRDRDRDSSFGKLFVGGISWETTEETFANYFSKYGEITDSVIMRDKHSGRPRGFGFVTFADTAVADKVLEEDHVIDGRTVEVKRTVPREDMDVKGVTRTKKIFVGGIPPSLADDELKEYFSLYGSIVEHQIMLDHKTGRSRGFGFVTFESEDAVEKVFSEGRTHELGGKEVEIKKAVPKRAGGDYGSTAKSYAGFSRGAGGYGGGGYSSAGRYGGKMGRGFGGSGAYGGYGGYGGYGNYGGSYGGSAAGFYGGYGGYGYGFGFGGPMYGGGGGGGGYGGSGYGTPSGYGGAAGYGGGKGYGRSGGGVDGSYGGGKGYGNGGDGSYSGRGYGNGGDGSYGGGKVYGNGGDGSYDDGSYGDGRGYGNGGDGSYSSGKGYGNGAVTGRYHPYRK